MPHLTLSRRSAFRCGRRAQKLPSQPQLSLAEVPLPRQKYLSALAVIGPHRATAEPET